jgi:SAM-dependent methyltransferase
MSQPLDAWDCYELCVQSPRSVVAFLAGAHAQFPSTLREDFAGTGAVSRRWAREGVSRGERWTARCVELDPAVADRGVALARTEDLAPLVGYTIADAVHAPLAPDDGVDVIYVGNFSLGYIHERASLVAYFARCRERLMLGNAGFGGGIFVCDLYGGVRAFDIGTNAREHRGRGKELVHYRWTHVSADPVTRMVENRIDLRVLVDGQVVRDMPSAFTYRWRLWSLDELRGAAHEAGLRRMSIYMNQAVEPGATPAPISERDLPEDWIVYVVFRA